MSESLAIALPELRGEVGLFLGYGRGEENGDPAWDERIKAVIHSIVSSGLRQFYTTPAVPEQNVPAAYSWSFMKPVAEFILETGSDSFPLPDDFGGVDGEILVANPGANKTPIPVSYKVRQMLLSHPSTVGRPVFAEIEPVKGVTARHGQRSQLRFWPTADQEYTLHVPYYLHGSALSDEAPYALGGAGHTETILESCLAVAEQRLNNASTVHSMKFHERLGASVAMDKRLKPQFVGTMRRPASRVDRVERFGTPVTYNGQSF